MKEQEGGKNSEVIAQFMDDKRKYNLSFAEHFTFDVVFSVKNLCEAFFGECSAV